MCIEEKLLKEYASAMRLTDRLQPEKYADINALNHIFLRFCEKLKQENLMQSSSSKWNIC
jgi:hypothetical protein